MIGLALVCSTVLSFFWIILMRFLTGLMVWLSISLIFVLTGGLLGYCVYRYAIKLKNTDDELKPILGIRLILFTFLNMFQVHLGYECG